MCNEGEAVAVKRTCPVVCNRASGKEMAYTNGLMGIARQGGPQTRGYRDSYSGSPNGVYQSSKC